MGEYWGNHILFDPSDLEAMFSNEHALKNYPSATDEAPPETIHKMEEVYRVMDMLPPREADFIELYFFKQVRQSAIAQMYGISQPTVCYRLRRGARRLKFLLDMPKHPKEEVEKDIRGVLMKEEDIQIMLLMLEKTCQSEVARALNFSQGLVRHRFLKILQQFRNLPGMEKTVSVFDHVCGNFNILKNTNRTKWRDPVLHTIE